MLTAADHSQYSIDTENADAFSPALRFRKNEAAIRGDELHASYK